MSRQKFQVDRYSLEYIGPRMEVDNTKRMVFADIRVLDRDGKERGDLRLEPLPGPRGAVLCGP